MNWEAIIAIVGVLSLLADVIMGVALYALSRRASVQDATSASHAKKMDGLESSVTHKAEQVVDARFQVLATEFKGMVGELRIVMNGIERRLARGDDAFDKQGEAHQSLEKKTIEWEANLKNWTMEVFGTRDELQAITERLGRLEVQAGRFDERIHNLEGKR